MQSYLTSRDAMLRLDPGNWVSVDKAFQTEIRSMAAPAPDATNEQTYKLYQKSVKIGYDPTEGVVNMEVIAPDPEALSRILAGADQICRRSGRPDDRRLREDQMQGSVGAGEDAEEKGARSAAPGSELHRNVLAFWDPGGEAAVVMGQIAELERQLVEKSVWGSLRRMPA